MFEKLLSGLRALLGRGRRGFSAIDAPPGVISLDRQVFAQKCPGCGATFDALRGSAYLEKEPFGLYMVALHGHSPYGLVAHLAVALRVHSEAGPPAEAAAIVVTSRPDRFECELVPWADSPWRKETYLGEMLGPDEVRNSPRRALFFSVVDRVVEDLPEVVAYFA